MPVHVFEVIVALVTGIAWPVVILILVLLFRGQITALADRVTSLKVAGVSAEIAQAALQAEEIEVGPDAIDMTAATDLLPQSPADAIQAAWNLILYPINVEVQRSFDPDFHTGILRGNATTIASFAEAGHIDRKYAAIAHSLFDVFVKAHSHPEVVSTSDALVYIQTVESLVRALRAAQQP